MKKNYLTPAKLKRFAEKRPSKYHAKRTTVDGKTFASKKEADHYLKLKALWTDGKLERLDCQVPFELHAPGGKKIGRYLADFRTIDWQGKRTVIDVKGFRTPLYRWKKRHVEAEYGIEVVEV